MRLTTQVGLLAGASALALAGTATANDQEARIAELEAKVAELTGQNWMNETRAAEVRGLVQDVLADADTRSSLLQGGGVGYDNGFVIGNPNGDFGLRINGQLQTRYIWNNQDDAVAGDANRAGFENTRTKLWFTGNAGAWEFMVEGNFGLSTDTTTADGQFNLEDAWAGYNFGNGWSAYMGQGRLPLQREHAVRSAHQLAVERSTMSYVHPHGRTQGLLVKYEMDQFRGMGAYTDGVSTATPAPGFANSAVIGGTDTEYAFTFRGEYLLSGNWAQFNDFTSRPGSEQGMMVGLGVHFQEDESGAAANEQELLTISGDFSVEMDGWNAFAAINYSTLDSNAAGFMERDLIGFVVQGGTYLNDTWEAFIRYEWNDFDDNAMTLASAGMAVDDHSVLTVGLNGYYTDNVKVTTDLQFGLNEVAATTALTGLRRDNTATGFDDGQFVWRTQLQLTF